METFKVPALNGETGLSARIPQPYNPEPLYALHKRNGNGWTRVSFEAYRYAFAHKLHIVRLVSLSTEYCLREVNDSPEANKRFGKGSGSNRPRIYTKDFPTTNVSH